MRRSGDATPEHDDLRTNGSYDLFQNLTQMAPKSIEDGTRVRIGGGVLGDGFNRLTSGRARLVVALKGAR